MMKCFLLLISLLLPYSSYAKTIKMVQAAKSFLGNITEEQAANAYDDPLIEEEHKVESLKLKLGDKINFQNRDEVSHNVSLKQGENFVFDVKLQEPGSKNDRVMEMTKKGEFDIQCAIHPKMKIKLIVE